MSMNICRAALLSGFTLIGYQALADQEEFSSSFAGFDFDINGIRLDLPAEESLKAFDPDFYFKKGQWNDSQGEFVREDVGTPAFGRGHINSVRESYRISVTPWHAGNLSYEVMRDVNVNRDDKMPAVADFVAATKAKYGEPTSELQKALHRRSGVQMLYAIKDGRFTNAPCFAEDIVWFGMISTSNERRSKTQARLDQINSTHCDAVLSVHYTEDPRTPGRIRHFGATARDFRLEAVSFIADVEEREAATKTRQDAIPKAAPDL